VNPFEKEMTMAEQCVQFPDIFEQIPKGTPKDERKIIEERNAKNERLYKAVRYILKTNFDLKDQIPAEPEDFAGAQLSSTERAQFVAILGIIQADNWDDPRNGKDKPSVDDAYVRGDKGEAAFVIDRRFIDAVVEAVKEYTASSKLFNNVYELMRDVAGPDRSPAESARSSPAGRAHQEQPASAEGPDKAQTGMAT
jgi:hypothetical protein